MKKIFALFIVLVFLFGTFAYAEEQEDFDETEEDSDEESEDLDDEIDETEEDSDEESEDLDDEIDETEEDSEKSKEKESKGNKVKVKHEDGSEEEVEVKVMPETASEKAIEALSLHNCVEEEGCVIELKEVGEGKYAYEVETEKDAKLFGLFKTKMHVLAQVDAETGEIIKAKKSWWAFLATEDDEEVVEEELETSEVVIS
jgi:hypothetical protein